MSSSVLIGPKDGYGNSTIDYAQGDVVLPNSTSLPAAAVQSELPGIKPEELQTAANDVNPKVAGTVIPEKANQAGIMRLHFRVGLINNAADRAFQLVDAHSTLVQHRHYYDHQVRHRARFLVRQIRCNFVE